MKNKILLLIIVATLGLTATTLAQVPSYVPTNGLVGYWPFNGNANDESGNGNNGTVNGATLTSDRNGNQNKAYLFDSLYDHIIIPDAQSLSLLNTNFTFNSWILPFDNGFHIIWYKGFSAGNDMLKYFFGWENDKFSYHINGPGLSTGIWAYSTTIPDINWQMGTIVKLVDTIKFYINGSFINQTVISNPVSNTTGYDVLIGSNEPQSTSGFWNGKLDDIGIWNRALNQQEITDLYNGCQLSVSTQPSNQTININNTAQFIVGSSDTNATYQWQTNLGLGFQNVNNAGQYNGTTNDTLTVANVAMNNNNQQFHCIINSGSCVDTSNVAVLTINNNVGIHEIAQHNLFSVFPNPAHNIINVKADHKLIGSVFTIYDNTGKAVQSGKINAANTSIELSNLSSGFYLFSVGNHVKQPFKVIKE
jgi:hypothetical protein